MAISMVVILGVVFVWLAMVPRPNQISQPPVDVTSAARQVRRDIGWPISQPQPPQGWYPTSVRFVRSTDGLMTWHAGYLTTAGSYVAIEQTRGATMRWVEAQTNRGRADGTQQAGGRSWDRVNRTDKVQRSLVDRGESDKDLTTILTGTATWAELGTFADSLQPVPAPQ